MSRFNDLYRGDAYTVAEALDIDGDTTTADLTLALINALRMIAKLQLEVAAQRATPGRDDMQQFGTPGEDH